MIKKWINEYVRERELSVINDFYNIKDELEKHVVNNSFEIVGLNTLLKISVVEPFVLKFDYVCFPVLICDYENELDIQLKFELLISDNIKAILNNNKDHELIIKNHIREFFKNRVGYHDFIYSLKGSILEQLKIYINSKISDLGRTLGYFVINSDDLRKKPDELVDIDINTSIQINEYPNPITLKNKIQLVLKNAGKYIEAKSPDLNHWCRERIANIISDVLFNSKYIDLLINFDPIRKDIKNKLQGDAESIGYMIKHLITIPDLKPMELLKDFEVELEDKFQTKNSRFDVKLRVVAIVRINNLIDIQDFLNPNIDIHLLMKQKMVDKVRQILHTVDPERFYMRFDYTDVQNEICVSEEIIVKISKLLQEIFRAEVVGVTPVQLETEHTERFKRLTGKICDFVLELTSFQGSEKIIYDGNFKIIRVHENGWETFQGGEYTEENIKGFLVNALKAKLETLSEEDLLYYHNNHLVELTKVINSVAEKEIENVFGLVIKITSFYRRHTDNEKAISQVKLDIYKRKIGKLTGNIEMDEKKSKINDDILYKENESKKLQLEKINDAIVARIAIEGDEEGIAELNKKKKKLVQGFDDITLDDVEKELNDIETKVKKTKVLGNNAKLLIQERSGTSNPIDLESKENL